MRCGYVRHDARVSWETDEVDSHHCKDIWGGMSRSIWDLMSNFCGIERFL